MMILGDCVEVLPTLRGVDAIVTDPPYGMRFMSGAQKHDRRSGTSIRIRNENFFEEIQGDHSLPVSWLKGAFSVLKDGGAIYVFCRWNKWAELTVAAEEAGFTVKNMIVMVKSNHGMGDIKGSFAPKHELVMFASKGRHILNMGPRPKDVIEVPVIYSGAHRLHPNEKRSEWLTTFIEQSTLPGDTVLDPFAGCGSTGEVCHCLGREFIGIEMDEHYFNIANKRLTSL